MERLVPVLLAEIPRDGRCLEIGVGTGRIALPLVRAGVSIVGVDISREMLRRLIENAGQSAPSLVMADATRLPFGTGTFSSVIAAHVFHLIPSWTIAIDELLRVLRPGGVILATRGAGPSTDWVVDVRRHFFVEAGDPRWPPGVDRIEALDEHMRSLGIDMRALPTLSTDGELTIGTFISNLEAGYFSACWSLDEPTRRQAATATRQWAAAQLGDLDSPRAISESSVWHAYVAP
ncbi:MAG: class I SAM-dependent methyltransferase [Candidatus Dormibacteraceae bacterium]